jgi:hypothetical protein
VRKRGGRGREEAEEMGGKEERKEGGRKEGRKKEIGGGGE